MNTKLINSFRRWSKDHPNFMTPNIFRIVEYNNYIIEISDGTGIDNKTIYGVSIFKLKDNKFVNNLDKFEGFSKCFNSYSECLIQLDNIKKRINDLERLFGDD